MLMVFAGTGERQPVTASNSGIASRQNNFLVMGGKILDKRLEVKLKFPREEYENPNLTRFGGIAVWV
jgi:hypothetical protein